MKESSERVDFDLSLIQESNDTKKIIVCISEILCGLVVGSHFCSRKKLRRVVSSRLMT